MAIDSNSDYTDFSYQQFMAFLLNEVDPPLSTKHNGIKLQGIPKQIDVIYHSPAKRSIQTAALIQERLARMGHKRPRVSSDLQKVLAEVQFSKEVLSEKEFKKNGGLRGCRAIILRKWYDGKNIETFQDSIERVEKLCNFLKNSDDENILLITHGWYIRLLFMYFKNEKKDFVNLTSKDGMFKYGQGFWIRLTNSFSPDPSFIGNMNCEAVARPESESTSKDDNIREQHLTPA